MCSNKRNEDARTASFSVIRVPIKAYRHGMSHVHVAWSPRLSARCTAGTLSLLAHVTVLGILLSPPAQKDGPSSIGRRVGSALIVRLTERIEPRPPMPVVRTSRQAPSPSPHLVGTDAPPPAIIEASSPISPAPPSPLMSPDTPSAPADQPAAPQAATPASSPPGASFANLFAPIINRPMGRGRWTSPPSQLPPPVTPALQRQQAAQARRDQLMQTIQWLQRQLDLSPLAQGCLIQVTLQQSSGDVKCSTPDDQDRILSAMSALLLTGLQPNVPSEVCLQLQHRTIHWVDCQHIQPTN